MVEVRQERQMRRQGNCINRYLKVKRKMALKQGHKT
jgi:hypothetical protein